MTLLRTAGPVLVGALALAAVATAPARAQATSNGYTSYTAQTLSSVAGCPGITWRLVRNPKGEIHGYATFADLSGVSFVKGMRDDHGNIKLDLTPTGIGSGPSGQVTGHRQEDGEITAKLTGSGCANANIHFVPGPAYSSGM